MSDFTPTLDEARAIYALGTPAHHVTISGSYAEFDRMIAKVRAEAKAEELRAFADEVRDFSGDTTARHIEDMARARADKLDTL